MPQLNPDFFLSQIFWLVITFSFLLFFLWKISLPRISYALKNRENRINDDLQKAKKLQTEAEEIQIGIDQQLNTVKEEIAQSIQETKKKLQEKVSSQIKKIDSDLTKKINESEINIEKKKNDNFDAIKIQIKEITKLTLSKLSNIDANDKEIEETINITNNKMVN